MEKNVLPMMSVFLPDKNPNVGSKSINIYIHTGDARQETEMIHKGILAEEKKLEDRISSAHFNSFMHQTISHAQSQRIEEYLDAKFHKDVRQKLQIMTDQGRKEIEDMKYDAVLSDTYPLNPSQQGKNDIEDLECLKKILKKDGIFTFFAWFPRSTGGVVGFQRDLIGEHFTNYTVYNAQVNPPKEYTYLRTEDGRPVLELPVVICTNPRV